MNMNTLTKSIAIALAIFTGAATTTRGETFPIFADTAGSTVNGKIAKASNKAKTLAISSKSSVFIDFGIHFSGLTANKVASARLTLYLVKVTKPGTLNFSTLNSAFDEGFATATAVNPGVDAPFTNFPIDPTLSHDFIIVDVTDQVKAWLNNPGSEHGLAITGDGGVSAVIASKEGAASGHPAEVEIDVNPSSGPISGSTASFTGAIAGASAILTDTVISNRAYVGTSNGQFISSFAGGFEVKGGNAGSSGIARLVGGGLDAALDLSPFDPGFGNPPATRIRATDDGGFGGHLDFLT